MALTARQEAFVTEFIKCRNATEAARRVGYAFPNKQGPRELVKVGVREEIKRLTAENAMDLDEALSLLADTGRADLGEWINDDGEIDIAAMKRAKVTRLIRKVKRTRQSGVSRSGTAWENVTVEVELHDAKDAQKFIAELHTRGPSGKENDPIHFKVIEGPKDVR